MKNKNNKITFILENEIDFYEERLTKSIARTESLKGLQITNYKKHSVLFNPEDIEYSKEELKEKYNQVLKLKEELEKLI